MKQQSLSTFVLIVILFNSCQKETKVDQWQKLFNGKDLSGWKANEDPSSFKVENGEIIAHGNRSHLFYVGDGNEPVDIKNFELSAEIMTLPKANSGIYFHTTWQEEGWPEKGYEVQVNNTHPGGGDYKELKKSASLYGVRNVYKAFAKDNTWYTTSIRVVGNHIQVRLDSILTVDYYEPKAQGRQQSGTLAIQGHDPESTVHFKNIRLRILPESLSPDDEKEDLGIPQVTEKQGDQFAFIDMNVPVGANFNLENALSAFYSTGINLGLVVNEGDANEFLSRYKNYPVLLGLNVDLYEDTVHDKGAFDYTIGEINSFKDKSGKIIDLHSEEKVGNVQSFMDEYVAAIVNKLNTGNLDIWASPTLLPSSLMNNYDKLWTKDRMMKVVEAAKNNGVAIEINNAIRLPHMDFLKLAKEHGCQFTNTGIYLNSKMTTPDYFLEVIETCSLMYKDIYIPHSN